MSFSKVCLGNSACFFRGVWEKHRESDVSKFCKIPRASIKERPVTLTLTPNCLTHSPSRHSFWDKNFFRFTSISLASKLIIYGRIRFFFSPRRQNCWPHKGLHNFLGVYICCIFYKFLKLFRFTISKYFSHCFKIRISIISVSVKMHILNVRF